MTGSAGISPLTWAQIAAVEARLTAAVSERMIALADLREGQRALDLGCGAGEPALRIAARVGATGAVLGVDPSPTAIERARARARESGLTHARFEAISAEDLAPEGPNFDCVFARWSLMAMPSPERALRAARSRLEQRAPCVIATWAARELIDWWSVPRAVTERFAELAPVDPLAPGATRFATREHVERAIAQTGFEIAHEAALSTLVYDCEDPNEMVSWIATVFQRWVARIDPDALDAWRSAMLAALSAHRVEGRTQLGGLTRLFVLRAR